jgi:gliding motility-associated lipoprotein GldH
MKQYWFALFFAAFVLCSCDDSKVYQQFADFEDRSWYVSDKPKFEFNIDDAQSSYNVYWNVRNSTQYPYARIFVNFILRDSSGTMLHNKLLNEVLFDTKSGEPSGVSGLGDLFDHRSNVIANYKFPGKGPYTVEFEQFMRTDTLGGIISVGLEIEKVVQP